MMIQKHIRFKNFNKKSAKNKIILYIIQLKHIILNLKIMKKINFLCIKMWIHIINLIFQKIKKVEILNKIPMTKNMKNL